MKPIAKDFSQPFVKYFSRQFEIFKVSGIPIRLDASWFIIFLIYTWTIAAIYLPAVAPELSRPVNWLLGIATTLLLFLSVLIHELAHCFFARRAGVGIKAVTLYFFGGLAHLDREPDTPAAEFKIAAAGPAASLALAFSFYLAAELLFRSTNMLGLAKTMLHLGAVNLLVACFNLLPGFPMDGGRILRAIVWYRGKDYFNATRTSLQSGATIAIALICVGSVTLLVQRDWMSGIWSISAGLFLARLLRNTGPEVLRAIKAQQRQQPVASQPRAQSAESRSTITHLMQRSFTTARPDMPLDELIKSLVDNQRAFPVVQESRLHGFLRLDDAEKIPEARRAKLCVRDIMQPVMTEHFITRDLTIDEASERINSNGFGHAVVLDNDGLVVGYLSLKDLPIDKRAGLDKN